jgi:hypothetical protein
MRGTQDIPAVPERSSSSQKVANGELLDTHLLHSLQSAAGTCCDELPARGLVINGICIVPLEGPNGVIEQLAHDFVSACVHRSTKELQDLCNERPVDLHTSEDARERCECLAFRKKSWIDEMRWQALVGRQEILLVLPEITVCRETFIRVEAFVATGSAGKRQRALNPYVRTGPTSPILWTWGFPGRVEEVF